MSKFLECFKCGHIWKDDRSWGNCTVICPECLKKRLNSEENSIDNISTENLEKELEKRNKLEKPKPLTKIDTEELIKICTTYIDEIEKGEMCDFSDLVERYIFAAAIEAVFGDKIWDWINKKSQLKGSLKWKQ